MKKDQKAYEEAAVFFGRASQQDIAEAWFELGMLYSSGLGVIENLPKAEECLTKAADLGHSEARNLQKTTMTATTKGNIKKLFAKLVSEIEMKKDASAILMPEPAIVAEMYKKSKKGKDTSQKRLFILHGPFFSYYKESGDSYSSYRMNLRGGKVERLYQKDTKSEFYFQVTAQFEELECYAHDLALVEKWVSAIERAVLYYTYHDTKSVFLETKSKPEEDDLAEENRFRTEMLNAISKVERLYQKDTKSEFYFQVTAQFEELECYAHDLALVEKWVSAIERAVLYYTYHDTKSVFLETKSKPEEDDLAEENRFRTEMLNAIIKAGWLQKQGGKRKNWNKRWFVLVRDNLFYFKDEHTKTPEPEGGIPLEYCTVILNAKDTMDIPKKNAIGILTLYRNYYIQAASGEEMVSWANAIEAAADACTARSAVNVDELKERAKNPPGSPRATNASKNLISRATSSPTEE
eukprot:TRINITY_DN16924_c0_g3_i1.p1 TRINITY_DN16924_c0_g3~~TRINITY_DN16924_c0_g3_i1.p1  ORF type:complete len:495 (+),score=149.17 TRINITY_DN16924_c0_g3_i1:92-1486(+)